MSQISNIIKNFAVKKTTPVVCEDACAGSTGAAAIAAAPVPLFKMVQRTNEPAPKKKKKKTMREAVGLTEMNHTAPSSDTPVDDITDSDRIISHLKKSEKESRRTPDNTEVFGLQDEDGTTITVSVSAEDADGFKTYLQSALAQMEDDDMDIAELLYNARNMFNIVDVNWPDIEENEERRVGLKIDTEDTSMDNEPAEGEMPEMPSEPAPTDTGDTASLLSKVIDMMRSDAEARKAEAEARALEAKHKEATLVVQQASDRIKHEEELLDMEAWEKANKDRDREAKQLARLAKWKHALKKDKIVGSDTDTINDNIGDENEERSKPPIQLIPASKKTSLGKRVDKKELSSFILSRLSK